MANYDAEVRIGTKVDTSQMQRLNIQIDKAVMKVDALSKKYEEVKNQKIPTEAFVALESKLQTAQAELQKLIDEENRLTEAGLAIGAPWDNLIRKEADAQLKIEAITAQMQNMKDAGTAFTVGDPEKIREAAQNLALGKKELAALVTKQDELIAKQGTTVKKSRSVSEGLKRIGEVGKKAFAKMNSHAKRSGGLFQTMASRLKGILLSLLIFNWITKGFNAMVSGMKKGFKNLVLYSEEYNRSVSSLKSANTQLQNSWASAFMPIVQMAIPHIITLINYVTSAANAIAQFTAVLAGKSTWMKAVAVQEDYAASLNGTAAAAKKAAGALASFDTLEVLSKKDSSGGSGAGSTNPKDMFEEVPIEPAKFDPRGIGKLISDNLADALEDVEWDKIKERAEQLGRDFANILNGIWENERLAKDLGMTVGEAANTAVKFAYGFVDEHEWRQMGRFLGTLVQTGLDTFDEETAGVTAGKLVNGLADAINGYFQKYEAGSTGAEIAGFLNRAVDEIDADLVGSAISLVVGGFFKEISTFFSDADFREIGGKLSGIIISALTYSGEDGSVGNKAGEAIASIINAGVDCLLGADTTGMSEAFGEFLTDMLLSAVEDIGWEKVLQAITKGMTSIVDIPDAIGEGIASSILKAAGIDDETIEEAKNRTWTLGNIIETFTAGIKPLSVEGYTSEYSNLGDAIDSLGGKVESFAARTYAIQSGKIFDVSELQQMQTELGLLDSDIDAIIQSMTEADTQINLSSLGLEGYKGSWETFKTTLTESTSVIDAFSKSNAEMTESIGKKYVDISTSVETATNTVCISIDGMGEKTKGLKERITELSDHTSAEMDRVAEKTGEAGASFGKLDVDAGTSLENTSVKLNDWFSNSVEPYFSQEQWNGFSQNISQSMMGCLDLFLEDWTLSLEEWKILNEELYFGYDYWYALMSNMNLAFIDVNSEFQSEWQTATDAWWNTMVLPFFTLEQWQQFGTNMKTGIVTGFKVIVNEIGGVLNKVISMFNEAFKELEESMNDLIDSYNSSASTLGTSTLSRVRYKPMSGIKIPALADGAVLRGGNPFMAILNDQRAGQTNIETPLDTMLEAFNRALDSRGTGSGQLNVALNVNGEKFAQATLDDFEAEINRRGGIDIDLLGGTT